MMRALPAFLAAALLAAAASAADLTATVHKAEVNVYAAANLESAKLLKLKKADSVGIAGQQGLWYAVKLPDGKAGFMRVNDVRVNYGRVEDSDANVRVLTGGKAGVGRVSETAGVRGIDESELKAAAFNQAQFDAMVANRADAPAASAYAGAQGWQATTVAWDGEAKPKKDENAALAKSDASTLAGLGSMLGSLGSKASSALGTASKVAPKAEQEQAA
jgi:beta-barrel assembly-enhancing protease